MEKNTHVVCKKTSMLFRSIIMLHEFHGLQSSLLGKKVAKLGIFMGHIWDLPSGYVKIAIENGHRNSEFCH